MIGNQIDTILIDSNDRLATSTSTTDFIVKFPSPRSNIHQIEINSIAIPLIYDNIVTGVNDVITLATVTNTLDSGYYNVNTLINALNVLTLGNYTWKLEYNTRITISEDAAANFVFVPGTMSDILGFVSTDTYSGASEYTGTLYPNLIKNQYLTLHSKTLCKRTKDHIYTTGNDSNVIAVIPISADQTKLHTYIPPIRLVYTMNDSSIINYCDFTLIGDDDLTVDIDNKPIQILITRY